MENFIAIFIILLALIPIIAILFIAIQDWYRRRKHPRYFELYRVAMEASNTVNQYFVKNVEPFDTVLDVITKGHNDGIISDNQYLTLCPIITDTFNTYKNKYDSQVAESKLLWSAVHKYAVDNGIKWGEVM